MFDYYIDASRAFPPEFRAWNDIVPAFQYRKDVPFFQMLVPTQDTVGGGWLCSGALVAVGMRLLVLPSTPKGRGDDPGC